MAQLADDRYVYVQAQRSDRIRYVALRAPPHRGNPKYQGAIGMTIDNRTQIEYAVDITRGMKRILKDAERWR